MCGEDWFLVLLLTILICPLTVFCCAIVILAKHSTLVILCGSCLWMSVHEYTGHCILKQNCYRHRLCRSCSYTSKLIIKPDDEPGFCCSENSFPKKFPQIIYLIPKWKSLSQKIWRMKNFSTDSIFNSKVKIPPSINHSIVKYILNYYHTFYLNYAIKNYLWLAEDLMYPTNPTSSRSGTYLSYIITYVLTY